MRTSIFSWYLLIFTLVLASATSAAEFAWMEAEKPTSHSVVVQTETFGALLSGNVWLHMYAEADQMEKTIPAEGAIFGYDFNAAVAGNYEVWNRIGFEGQRPPFDWRIDQGEWQSIQPTQPTDDLVELAFWVHLAWLKLGALDLTAGQHSLQIRIPRYYINLKPQKIVYSSDALCVYHGAFHPNGAFQPGTDWQNEQDKAAAKQTFMLQVPADASARIALPLAGNWQIGRYDELTVVDRDKPTTTLPDLNTVFWTSIAVPSNKFDKAGYRLCHRFIYRTQLNVPAILNGRSFSFRFPANCMISSLFVNGQYCGGSIAPDALWECDASRAIHAGAVNDICVVVKDNYYAVSPKKTGGKSCHDYFQIPLDHFMMNWTCQFMDFPVGSPAFGITQTSGILLTPSVVVAGSVYTEDVFAKPSVKEKTLGLEVTLLNPSANALTVQVTNEVVPATGGKAEKIFAPQDVTLAAGAEQTLQLSEPWANPTLWWPDSPTLYNVVTKVAIQGIIVDVKTTRFGFRQWEWDGPQFKLNGVRWQFYSDDIGNNLSLADAVKLWHETGRTQLRFVGLKRGELTKDQVLDYLDESGMIVRRSGIFDGMGANYLNGLSNNPELFDNWQTQLKAQVKEERNHPSLAIWSLENEITFINSRNLGQLGYTEPQTERVAKSIMALDPTRPVMVDGGDALTNASLPVSGSHYIEAQFREYPDEAYTLTQAYNAFKDRTPGALQSPWPIMPDKPLFMGEAFFVNGFNPAAFSQIGGEGCFAGWGGQTQKTVSLLMGMYTEGYRWQGVGAWAFGGTGDFQTSCKPVALFCREWNWTFGSGSTVPRSLKLFNDTHYADPIEAAWELDVAGKRVAGDKTVYTLAAGEHKEFTVSFTAPKVNSRTAATFILSCSRGGKEVFRDTKAVVLIDPNGVKPKLAAGALAVIDPDGAVKARLTARGIAFAAIDSIAAITAGTRIIVVGKDALNARDATDPRWVSFIASGGRVLVLDQLHPLHYLATPADLQVTGNTGRVAFIENTTHPVFAGLDQPDFFTWSKDHIVYRNAYQKATVGALSLLQCDDMLNYSALDECQVNDGMMLLCQLVVGEKLATDPVAQKIFDNMLAYCADYQAIHRTTAVVMDVTNPANAAIVASGLKFDRLPDLLAAIADGKHQIVVFDATAANLKMLADNRAKMLAFTKTGGWLMAMGLTPDGLADFNRLVGVEHLLRPFELEKVDMPLSRDPLLSGITSRDVVMESAETIFPWAGYKYLVNDEFSWIVDFDEIAPFGEYPGSKAGDLTAAHNARAGWSRNVVNGFVSSDGWPLIYYMQTNNAKLPIKLPRQEEINGFSLVINRDYAKAGQVKLYFDNDPIPVVFPVQDSTLRQDFIVNPARNASTIVVELAQFSDLRVTTGIDNLWLQVTRTPAWRQQVKPLLSIGGLVKYPMGQGGIILNQLHFQAHEAVPINAQKKGNITATLLRNLHATFSGGKVIATNNLTFTTLPLAEKCTQFLTKDRGWLNGNRDLGHLPIGNTQFAGVNYDIRDFRTSPLPSCIMLAGQGAKGQLPNEVKGIKAGVKADMLFFLHTFNVVNAWRASRGNDIPPVLFSYVIHYADDQTVEVPVLYGEGVAHWISANPSGLKSASVAWCAPFPADNTGEQAVLYQLQWTNPRPDVAIQTIDIVYGPAGSKYGEPVLLAITGGVVGK